MARWKQPTSTDRAMASKRESKHVDFKEKFDPKSEGEWCELLKDFAAVANIDVAYLQRRGRLVARLVD